MEWIVVAIVAFIILIVIPASIELISEISSSKLFRLLIISIFVSSFHVKLFYPKVGLAMYFIDFILLSLGIYAYYNSLKKDNDNEDKKTITYKIIKEIPAVLFLVGYHIIRKDISNISLFTIFIFIIVYYIIHTFYHCNNTKDIFINLNYYFFPFFTLGLVFMFFTSLYPKNQNNTLFIATIILSIIMVILFYNGLSKSSKKGRSIKA